jgi:hypothetical protein
MMKLWGSAAMAVTSGKAQRCAGNVYCQGKYAGEGTETSMLPTAVVPVKAYISSTTAAVVLAKVQRNSYITAMNAMLAKGQKLDDYYHGCCVSIRERR